ncbi:hypothetical protein DID88_009588 [Monilinia fructigena]|uniref:Large ribosomal subunit protein bL27m n=1 Tax=Monilinia fructigena TaxID=38457 RepID=A0A395IT74_9HELO|nr:hypothetical protein DID88_009588 [Monilinia fructigena]
MLLQRLQPPLRSAITSITRTSSASAAETPSLRSPHKPHIQENFLSPRPSHRHSSCVSRCTRSREQSKRRTWKETGCKEIRRTVCNPRQHHIPPTRHPLVPGDNCAMGRDHTIYATQPGYVKYYKDPERHPKRQYIGVVFKRDQVLPLPRNTVRRRRLGMEVATIVEPETPQVEVEVTGLDSGDASVVGVKEKKKKRERKGEEGRNLQLRPGYIYYDIEEILENGLCN